MVSTTHIAGDDETRGARTAFCHHTVPRFSLLTKLASGCLKLKLRLQTAISVVKPVSVTLREQQVTLQVCRGLRA